MISKIIMKIPNYSVNLKDNGGTINGKAIVFSDDDLNDIIRTIRLWNNYYKGNIINETKYYINLYDKDDKKINSFYFDGDYPSNFDNLLSVIGRLYNGK